MKRILSILRQARASARSLAQFDRRVDEIKINQGRILTALGRQTSSTQLQDHEFKVFSQWGEDGIIQYLVANLAIRNRTFIEFGVEDFLESNCRFLMMKDGWAGFVVDGSQNNIARLRSAYFFWRHRLEAVASFVTRENINAVLAESGFAYEPGILSIDVDGVDYFILEALENWRPSVLVVEYNGIFGPRAPVSVPYDAGFVRSRAHFSNLYYGASLAAFDYLAGRRGYALVGVNSAGNNAFFVRRELLNNRVQEVSMPDSFRPPGFREARDKSGRLVYFSGEQAIRQIAHLPVVNVISGERVRVGDLDVREGRFSEAESPDERVEVRRC